MIFLHAQFLAGKGNHVGCAVHIFFIIPVFNEIILPGAKPFNLLHHPAGCRLQTELHARLVQFFMNQVQAVNEILFPMSKGRQEKHVLSTAGADEKNIILHRPLRLVGLLPQEKGIKSAVNLLIMMNLEKPSIIGLSSMRNGLNSMMSISL